MSAAEQARRVLAPVGRPVRRALVGRRTRAWAPHSRLFIGQEAAEWVLSYEARQLVRTAGELGVELGPPEWINAVAGQSIFHQSQFTLLLHDFERRGNNLGLAYFHGRPGTPGMPEFDACFETMRRRHREIDRVQVTNREMEELVLGTGMAPEKVHRIPIGIDVDTFPLRALDGAREARSRFGLPASAFVVGSFQKDGVGWGEGLEPKLIKGPDVLLSVAGQLRERVPELWFLLTGPSRGFVRTGLERLGIPYRHALLDDVGEVATAYAAIDVCLVASRDEGGPRAVLEVDGDGSAARHDPRRPGRRSRRARRERLDGRRRGRRGSRRFDRARRRGAPRTSWSACGQRVERPPRRTRTRSAPALAGASGGLRRHG